MRYLALLAAHYFALGLSGIFLNIFLWKLNQSLTVLAIYNLVLALALGYGVVLLFQERSGDWIALVGGLIGVGTSLFVVGQHLQTLDATTDRDRDGFLFLSNFVTAGSGILAPALAGFLINSIPGLAGFYLFFSLSISGLA